MKKYIIKLCEWILRLNGYMVIKVPQHDVYEFVKQKVEEIDSAPQSGEWKRHQVYALTIKRFPDENKRGVAYMIEQALVDKDGIWTN